MTTEELLKLMNEKMQLIDGVTIEVSHLASEHIAAPGMVGVQESLKKLIEAKLWLLNAQANIQAAQKTEAETKPS